MAERDFLLPDLGEGLEEAEIVKWLVTEGDTVTLNQPLVEVNTAKALVEIPSPFAGRIVTLHGSDGDIVFVGKPLVTFDVEGPVSSVAPGPGPAAEPKPKRTAVLVGYGVEEEEPPPTLAGVPARRERGDRPVPASPPVRRLAKELGVDLASVAGTGPGGRVTREDVEKASEAGGSVGPGLSPADAQEGEEHIPVRGTRRLVAEKMARSARDIPHVTTFLSIDGFSLDGYRRELQERFGERVSPLPIVVRALVETCKQHPKLNASFDADAGEIVLRRSYHVGIATDTERGLMVPVIRDADSKGILELATEIARLSEAAREGRSSPQELVGSTITVTNVGSFGAEFGTPIINAPESAILAVGVMEPRALVVDGEIVARPAMTLSLSFDHRLLDGAEAGRALRDLGDVLESPFRLGSLQP
ncbi:MAG: dihydrolipoamide acetyltransferase family protein [Actinomycetota bacterium]